MRPRLAFVLGILGVCSLCTTVAAKRRTAAQVYASAMGRALSAVQSSSVPVVHRRGGVAIGVIANSALPAAEKVRFFHYLRLAASQPRQWSMSAPDPNRVFLHRLPVSSRAGTPMRKITVTLDLSDPHVYLGPRSLTVDRLFTDRKGVERHIYSKTSLLEQGPNSPQLVVRQRSSGRVIGRLGDLADVKTDCHLAGADGKAVQQITWNQAQALLFPHAR